MIRHYRFHWKSLYNSEELPNSNVKINGASNLANELEFGRLNPVEFRNRFCFIEFDFGRGRVIPY